jgi:hypothetical protein
MLSAEEWRELRVTGGCVGCIFGFWPFGNVVEHGSRCVAVGESEVDVLFEMDAEDLRVMVERGVRGYACSAEGGLLPPFAVLEVRARVT